MIKVSIDVDDLKKSLAKDILKIRPAAVKVLNQLANECLPVMRKHMRDRLDKPTDFTQKSWIVKYKATPERLESTIGMRGDGKTDSEAWASMQIGGGSRRAKKFELAMKAKGFMLNNQYIMPTKDTPLDGWGNISRKFLSTIRAGLGDVESARAAKRAKTNKKQGITFTVIQASAGRKLPSGVWEIRRTVFGAAYRYVLAFVEKQPGYKKKLDFQNELNNYSADRFNELFKKEMDYK